MTIRKLWVPTLINALRYGFASFLRFSKPLTFSALAAGASYLIIFLTQWYYGQDLAIESLSLYGGQSVVMNSLVLFFLSLPVAAQFAQEYRFGTLGSTLLIAPKRLVLFMSKTIFALLYVAVSVILIWVIIFSSSPLFGFLPSTEGTNFSFLAVAGGSFDWTKIASDYGTALVSLMCYIFGYMLIVISLSVATKSQTLGAIIPFFYLGLVETLATLSDYLVNRGAMKDDWIPESFRLFEKGQAWLVSDPNFQNSGLVYFGIAFAAFAGSALLFQRRSIAH